MAIGKEKVRMDENESKGIRAPRFKKTVWLIGAGILAVIILALLTIKLVIPAFRSDSQTVECPNCESLVHEDDSFCMYCGTELIDTCPTCGKEITLGDRYCMHCGAEIAVKAADPVTVSETEKTITVVSVKAVPQKTAYYVGDTVDTTGLSLEIVYNNGDTEIIETGFECFPTVFTEAGVQRVSVFHGEVTASFDADVSEVLISSIEIETMPLKTSYAVGESLDVSGLVLTAVYNNGSRESISAGFDVDQKILNTPGTVGVTVSYKDMTTSFPVKVYQPVNVGDTVTFGPYEWIVLNKKGEKVLLLAKSAVTLMSFNYKEASVTWETCSLRTWLNGSFLEQFSEEDRNQMIVASEINDEPVTSDKVFLLSKNEFQAYLEGSSKRFCYYEGTPRWWWLRFSDKASYVAPCITNEGGLGGLGYHITDTGVRPAIWVDFER